MYSLQLCIHKALKEDYIFETIKLISSLLGHFKLGADIEGFRGSANPQLIFVHKIGFLEIFFSF
jgi:hypothetical protein